MAEIKAHWPADAVEVSVDGHRCWILGGVGGKEHDQELLRLLGGFDLFLQGKDRDLIVPDKSKHQALWPVIGRPGAVLCGTEITGTWRPKTAGDKFTLHLDPRNRLSLRSRKRLELEAERLAAHRGLQLAAIVED